MLADGTIGGESEKHQQGAGRAGSRSGDGDGSLEGTKLQEQLTAMGIGEQVVPDAPMYEDAWVTFASRKTDPFWARKALQQDFFFLF